MRHLLLIFFVFSTLAASSQNFLSWQYSDRYFSLSIGSGTSTYFGELNYNNTISDDLSQINGALEVRLLNRIGARFDVSYFTLEGSDSFAPDSSFQRQRNLSFSSRNLHFQFHVTYYLRAYQGDYYKRWGIDPFVFAGVGYMRFNPTAVLGSERFNLRDAKTEGVDYKEWVTTLPIGAGAKFKVNEFLNVNLEVSYHFTFTDYLDDVSNTYATEYANLTSELLSDRKDEIGITNPNFYNQIVPGARRGDPDNNDGFLQIALRAEIFLPPDLFSRKNNAIIKKPSAY